MGRKFTKTAQNQSQPPASLQLPSARLKPPIFLLTTPRSQPDPDPSRTSLNISLVPPLLPPHCPLSYQLKVSKVSGLPSSLTTSQFLQRCRVTLLTSTPDLLPPLLNPQNKAQSPLCLCGPAHPQPHLPGFPSSVSCQVSPNTCSSYGQLSLA